MLEVACFEQRHKLHNYIFIFVDRYQISIDMLPMQSVGLIHNPILTLNEDIQHREEILK
jgi:hypothetical protein